MDKELLIIVTLVGGALALGWWLHSRPSAVKHDGTTYYRQKDGRFLTRDGAQVSDPTILAGLTARWEAMKQTAAAMDADQ